MSIDPETPTGVCLVLISPDGERTMVPSAGANGTLRPAELTDPPLVSAGDRLHLSGYTLLNEGSRAAARYALAGAVQAGVPVSVDAASAAPIRALGGPRLLDWLPAGALLIANTDELAALTEDDPAGPMLLAARGFTVVIKDGGRGASLVHAGQRHELPTEPVPVLDSTGAGDAFAAGLLAALHGGEQLTEAVAAGNRAGARALRTVGGRPA